ncbi:MAG: GNAT family N-acetyltransferase [Ignavibacteriales bacterium]|nr:GNAT family N-acetyltransferase [Ignavibacteriales bacterium]
MKIEIDKSVFEKFPELESERLLFREFLLSDSKDLYLIESNDAVVRYMDKHKMESINDSENYIRSCRESYKTENSIEWGIIEKSSNSFIGYFGFWRIVKAHCRAEIGYSLNPGYWGKGYMTESLKTLLLYGFNKLKLHSIEANVNPKNKNSIKLLEGIGFKKEAYFRENFLFDDKFLDTITYSLLEKYMKDT